MTTTLEQYAEVAGKGAIDHLKQLVKPLKGIKVVHINSTKEGGGVAEILDRLILLKNELGIDARWAVINGNKDFFTVTKHFHNGLQGQPIDINEDMLHEYEETNMQNAEALHDTVRDADIVFIHDPQPAPLLRYTPDRQGKWIWRCHIDVSGPYRPVWKYLRTFVKDYDVSIWSLSIFAQHLEHTQYLIPPSIDPLSQKNIDLPESELDSVCAKYGIDRERPIVAQISRFDRFKDPLGVIRAYKLAKDFLPTIQLVLAGGSATDDPEGARVLDDVKRAADGEKDIHILELPPDSHRTINALQRASDVVMQKSLREGFGLTVTEALWKGKPVIGGNAGGIKLQVFNHHTGFLVNTPEGAALRLRYLLDNRDKMQEMGAKGKDLVRENFLLTRHLREYLTLMLAVLRGIQDRIEL